MKRVDFKELNIKKGIEKNSRGYVLELDDDRVLKVYNDDYLLILNIVGIDLENRILGAKKFSNVKEIIVPDSAVYIDDEFFGYTMPKAKGINYNDYGERLSIEDRENISKYVLEYLKLEDIIRRANKEKLVFPDLLTCDNIFVHNGNYSFIDYDGIQIGDNKVAAISSSLGDQTQYLGTKYMKGSALFTEQLDKKSLILLFFLTTFNINLDNVGKIDLFTGKRIELDDVFMAIDLDDYDIMNKVWKLFVNDENNEFLGDDLYNLIDKYNLKIIGKIRDNCYVKRLIKK